MRKAAAYGYAYSKFKKGVFDRYNFALEHKERVRRGGYRQLRDVVVQPQEVKEKKKSSRVRG